MTPPRVAAYLITDYLYHWTCLRCSAVEHSRPGVGCDKCDKCGCNSWSTRCSMSDNPDPWYMQYLDPDCPTCQRTANELHAMTAQMELFT